MFNLEIVKVFVDSVSCEFAGSQLGGSSEELIITLVLLLDTMKFFIESLLEVSIFHVDLEILDLLQIILEKDLSFRVTVGSVNENHCYGIEVSKTE